MPEQREMPHKPPYRHAEPPDVIGGGLHEPTVVNRVFMRTGYQRVGGCSHLLLFGFVMWERVGDIKQFTIAALKLLFLLFWVAMILAMVYVLSHKPTQLSLIAIATAAYACGFMQAKINARERK